MHKALQAEAERKRATQARIAQDRLDGRPLRILKSCGGLILGGGAGFLVGWVALYVVGFVVMIVAGILMWDFHQDQRAHYQPYVHGVAFDALLSVSIE